MANISTVAGTNITAGATPAGISRTDAGIAPTWSTERTGADGSGFTAKADGPPDIFGSGEKVKVRGYHNWTFGATARFRLLLKGSLMEFYLDE
jgi:hypothetical protein